MRFPCISKLVVNAECCRASSTCSSHIVIASAVYCSFLTTRNHHSTRRINLASHQRTTKHHAELHQTLPRRTTTRSHGDRSAIRRRGRNHTLTRRARSRSPLHVTDVDLTPQVLRRQYYKEIEQGHVSTQSKFNYGQSLSPVFIASLTSRMGTCQVDKSGIANRRCQASPG